MTEEDDKARPDPIRVAIDGNFLGLPHSGVGTYVRELARALDAGRETLGIETSLILPHPGRMFRQGTRRHRFAWDAIGVSAATVTGRPRARLLHLPQMSAPIIAPIPCVVTIHDTIPLSVPDYRATRAMQVYLALMARTARHARHIIVPSRSAADDVQRVLGVALERITVIAEAASPDLVPDWTGTAERQARERFGVQGPYVFNIGGFDKRKNLPLLVEAFGAAVPSLPEGATLVIAGASHSSNPRVFPPLEPVVRKLGLGSKVLLTGRISDDDRRLLYQGAVACVTPSLHEGFGLTPLEAMACGTPAIVANRTSLPEVVGDAGVIVEPEADALAAAIIRIMTDGEFRANRSRLGVERAALFSWERAAVQTADVYRTVLAEDDSRVRKVA